MFAAMAFYLLKIHKVIQTMSKKHRAQKIAGTPCTRMLGKSLVCQNSGVGKKGKMLESCQQRQQRRKKQISGQKKIFPADALRAFGKTHARTSAGKNCLFGD